MGPRCPSYLDDRMKYANSNACNIDVGFENMNNPKQYLKRVHTQPQRCPHCQIEVTSHVQLTQHLRTERECERRPEPHDDRISQDQWENIESAKSTSVARKTINSCTRSCSGGSEGFP